MKEFYFLVPPELGARGRLIVDLIGFYDLCVHGSLRKGEKIKKVPLFKGNLGGAELFKQPFDFYECTEPSGITAPLSFACVSSARLRSALSKLAPSKLA